MTKIFRVIWRVKYGFYYRDVAQENMLEKIMTITSKLREKWLKLDLHWEKDFKCLHESDVYHLDNILINSKTGDVKIIDISISDTDTTCADLNLKNYNWIIKRLKTSQ